MGKTGLINCFGGWASTPNSIESRLSDLSATRTAKCGIEGFQLADTHENHSICDSGLSADLRRCREIHGFQRMWMSAFNGAPCSVCTCGGGPQSAVGD